MTAYRIASITIDQWGVNPVVDCLAEPGAWCGWECPDRCDDVPSAPTDTPLLITPTCLACRKPLRRHGGCVFAEWWADRYEMGYVGKAHPFVPGTIRISVDSYRYVWRYADEAGPDPGGAGLDLTDEEFDDFMKAVKES